MFNDDYKDTYTCIHIYIFPCLISNEQLKTLFIYFNFCLSLIVFHIQLHPYNFLLAILNIAILFYNMDCNVYSFIYIYRPITDEK